MFVSQYLHLQARLIFSSLFGCYFAQFIVCYFSIFSLNIRNLYIFSLGCILVSVIPSKLARLALLSRKEARISPLFCSFVFYLLSGLNSRCYLDRFKFQNGIVKFSGRLLILFRIYYLDSFILVSCFQLKLNEKVTKL